MFVYRKRQFDVNDLYQPHGRYRYSGGFSGVALAALALAVLPNIPGFLATIKVLPESSIAPAFLSLYRYAWFVGFALAFFIYLAFAPTRERALLRVAHSFRVLASVFHRREPFLRYSNPARKSDAMAPTANSLQ
ncbi:MAG TPA: cytosine permease [Chthoniobacterales bacterium]|nr:cytosine permease [Chthoniobacterales bacterium]